MDLINFLCWCLRCCSCSVSSGLNSTARMGSITRRWDCGGGTGRCPMWWGYASILAYLCDVFETLRSSFKQIIFRSIAHLNQHPGRSLYEHKGIFDRSKTNNKTFSLRQSQQYNFPISVVSVGPTGHLAPTKCSNTCFNQFNRSLFS